MLFKNVGFFGVYNKSEVLDFVMLGDLTDQIDMNMEKVPKLSRRVESKHKVFNFGLSGNLDESIKCINILNALDLNKHGIQFLCFREEGISRTDDTRKIRGLIETKEGTTVDGVMRFFRNLDAPLWDCTSLVSLCEDVNFWLYRSGLVDKRSIGVVLEKGTLTVPPYSPLFKVPEPEVEDLRDCWTTCNTYCS